MHNDQKCENIRDITQDPLFYSPRIMQQALLGIQESKCALLVCDGQEGVTHLDHELAVWIRKVDHIILYVSYIFDRSITNIIFIKCLIDLYQII